MKKSENILVGKKAIMQYLNIQESSLRALIEAGLPVKIHSGRYYSTILSLESFMNTWVSCNWLFIDNK